MGAINTAQLLRIKVPVIACDRSESDRLAEETDMAVKSTEI